MNNLILKECEYNNYKTFKVIYANNELILDRSLYAWYISYLSNPNQTILNIFNAVWMEIISEVFTNLSQYYGTNILLESELTFNDKNYTIFLDKFDYVKSLMEYKLDTRLIKQEVSYETTK